MTYSTVKDYLGDLKGLLDKLNPEDLLKIIEILNDARKKNKTIFLIGNGGSAATANHFVCDFGKNAVKGDENRFRVISLCDNSSCITAYGNDCGYDSVFIEQLKNLMQEGDIVLAISASGKSPNIVRAIQYAKKKNGVVIGLSGCDGGELAKLSDVSINIPAFCYEQIEDLHLVITHIIVYCFKKAQN